MTPEEKLLALIQQDKRQVGSVTPQEKLLALIEQDKRKAEPSLPLSPVVMAAPVPAPKPVPVPIPVKPSPIPAAVKTTAVEAVPTEPVKSAADIPPPSASKPVSAKVHSVAVVATPAPAQQPASPTTVAPVAVKKTPLVVLPPAAQNTVMTQSKSALVVDAPKTVVPVPLAVPRLSSTTQSSANSAAVSSASATPQPLLFPTIRVSGVTITNRVLAVMVMLLIIVVFYSVAGTQRGIDEEIQRQISGAGEMSVVPLAISEEPVPAVEVFLEKVSKRNFFFPKLAEKNKDGQDVPATVGLTKDFKLVAVSVDNVTVSESMAIIKSRVDSKTYFVKIGESVGDTGFVLAKVLTDRIVLKQRKQEFELK